MSLIIGMNGFNQLQLGYPVNINDVSAKTFVVANVAATEGGIEPGDLLITTSTAQSYTKVSGGSASDYTNKVAGIALATNVKLDPLFPQSSTDVKFMPGDHGACAIRGEVAVKLYGTAPAENAAVYYDITNKAFTISSSNTIALANMRFTGVVEGNVAVVRVLY